MTSWHGRTFRITDHLWGESTSHRDIPLSRGQKCRFAVSFVNSAGTLLRKWWRAKIQSDGKIVNNDLVPPRLCEILRRDVMCDTESPPACYNLGHFIFTNSGSGWEWVRDRQTEIGRQKDRQGKTERLRKKKDMNRSKREENRGNFTNYINSLQKRRQCQSITTPVIKVLNMFYRPHTYIWTFACTQEIFIRHACAHIQRRLAMSGNCFPEIVFRIWPETHFIYCPWALQWRSMWTPCEFYCNNFHTLWIVFGPWHYVTKAITESIYSFQCNDIIGYSNSWFFTVQANRFFY